MLSRCFCSVSQTLRLRGVYVWMLSRCLVMLRFRRGVCVCLRCVFAVVGCAVFSRCICWGMLRFRGVFWPYGYVPIMIWPYGYVLIMIHWHAACIKEHAVMRAAPRAWDSRHSRTQCHARVYRIHHSHTPNPSLLLGRHRPLIV